MVEESENNVKEGVLEAGEHLPYKSTGAQLLADFTESIRLLSITAWNILRADGANATLSLVPRIVAPLPRS